MLSISVSLSSCNYTRLNEILHFIQDVMFMSTNETVNLFGEWELFKRAVFICHLFARITPCLSCDCLVSQLEA